MAGKRAFFGTFWGGGLGAVGRCLLVAREMRQAGFSCYFFAEGTTERHVRDAGFIAIRPPHVEPPSRARPSRHSRDQVVSLGTIFADLDEFFALRGYQDSEYVQRAFRTRWQVIEDLEPDILFGYWSWETTISARLMRRPLVTIIQRSLHRGGGGFAGIARRSEPKASVRSFNDLLETLKLPRIEVVEELMTGDLTLISGVPSTDPLPADPRTRYCGPLLWFAARGNQDWHRIQTTQKVAWVYASDEASWAGGPAVIHELVPILVQMGFFVLVSSGGHPVPVIDRRGVLCVEYVPGDLAAQRADLVVGRGGHDLFWTAIMAGKPFFGVPPNSEWLDYCQCARRLGVGDYVEAHDISRSQAESRIERLVTSQEVTARIEALRSEARGCAAVSTIAGMLRQLWPQLLS